MPHVQGRNVPTKTRTRECCGSYARCNKCVQETVNCTLYDDQTMIKSQKTTLIRSAKMALMYVAQAWAQVSSAVRNISYCTVCANTVQLGRQV